MPVPNEPITYEEDSIHQGGDRRRWVLVLNQYQRDNLLWLLNVVGYGAFEEEDPYSMVRTYGHAGPVDPFGAMNTGDWVGEVALKLAMPGAEHPLDAERTGRPNGNRKALRERIERMRDA